MKIFGGSTWYFHGLFCGLCRALFHRPRWKRALHILQQSPRLSTQFPVLRNSGWKYIHFRERNKWALHNPQKSPWLCTEFPAMIIIVGRTSYSWKVLCVFRKKARYIFRKRALRILPKIPWPVNVFRVRTHSLEQWSTRSLGPFRKDDLEILGSCRYLNIDHLVVQKISLRYVHKMLWYTLIVFLILLCWVLRLVGSLKI